MPIAECSALFSEEAALSISSTQRNFGNPLSATVHRIVETRICATHSDMIICCGVLVLAYSRDIPVCRQESWKPLSTFSPSFFGPQALDTETATNDGRLPKSLKCLKSIVLGLQQVSLRPLGIFIGDLTDILVAPE